MGTANKENVMNVKKKEKKKKKWGKNVLQHVIMAKKKKEKNNSSIKAKVKCVFVSLTCDFTVKINTWDQKLNLRDQQI